MNNIPLANHASLPIRWHNVDEIEPTPWGLTLYRIARPWRERFPERTAFRSTQAGGVELRFRANTRYVALDVQLDTQMGYNAALALYHGYRNASVVTLPARFKGRVVLMDRDQDILDANDLPWRILFPYGSATTVKTLYLSDGAELLPMGEPRPVRWLAHGDSITHGAHALHPGMTYVNLVADQLGWDAINMGFGGSAWGDAVVAEYIASRDDWDILSIAIGTNTFGGAKESAADFGPRYARFLEIIREAHPAKPVLCITPTWRRHDGPPEMGNERGDTPRDFREVIERVINEKRQRDASLALFDGLALINNHRGLTVDQLHPDPHGMRMMADGIAPALSAMMAK